MHKQTVQRKYPFLLLILTSYSTVFVATEKTQQTNTKASMNRTESANPITKNKTETTVIKTSEGVSQFAGKWVVLQASNNYFLRKEASASRLTNTVIGHVSDLPLHIDEGAVFQTGHDFKQVFSKKKCRSLPFSPNECILTTRSIQSREPIGILMRLATSNELESVLHALEDGTVFVENMSIERAIFLLKGNTLRKNSSAPTFTLAEPYL